MFLAHSFQTFTHRYNGWTKPFRNGRNMSCPPSPRVNGGLLQVATSRRKLLSRSCTWHLWNLWVGLKEHFAFIEIGGLEWWRPAQIATLSLTILLQQIQRALWMAGVTYAITNVMIIEPWQCKGLTPCKYAVTYDFGCHIVTSKDFKKAKQDVIVSTGRSCQIVKLSPLLGL